MWIVIAGWPVRAKRASRFERSGAASRSVVYETARPAIPHATEVGLSSAASDRWLLSSLGQGARAGSGVGMRSSESVRRVAWDTTTAVPLFSASAVPKKCELVIFVSVTGREHAYVLCSPRLHRERATPRGNPHDVKGALTPDAEQVGPHLYLGPYSLVGRLTAGAPGAAVRIDRAIGRGRGYPRDTAARP